MGKSIGLILALKDKCSPQLTKIAEKLGVTEKEAKKVHTQINKLSKDIGGKMQNAIKIMSVGVGAVVGTMGGLAVTAGATCDRIDDLSNKIGISRQGFQEWDYLLGQNGANIESLQMGMKTLVNQIDGVTKGNKNSVATFRALGISVKDSSGKLKNQEQIFNEVVTALQKMPDGAKKAKIANDLLGRSGSELMPLFNASTEQLARQREEYKKLGIAISDDVIDAGNQFGDSLEKLKSIGSSYGAVIGGEMLPVLNKLADSLINQLPKVRETLTPVLTAMGNVVKFLIDHLNGLSIIATVCISSILAFKAISGVITVIQTLQNVIKMVSLAQGVWNALMLANPIGLIATGIGLLIGGIVLLIQNWDAVKNAFIGFYEKIQPALSKIGQFIKMAFNMTPLGMFINGIKLLIQNWDAVVNAVQKAINAIKTFVGIKPKADVKVDNVEVKQNALGTSFYSGGLTRVNERGGEIIDLPRGTRIIPHDLSQKMTNNSGGISVVVNIQGNMVGNDEFLNKMASMFARKLQVAMAVN